MICRKCGFEYVDNLKECPNCQTPNEPAEAKILMPDERDTFSGITIDDKEGQAGSAHRPEDDKKEENAPRGTYVYHSSVKVGQFGFIWQLLILIFIAGLIFILLPAFLLVFMALAGFYLLLRLFR